MTRTQKLFRREPAITKFDKLFTSYHKSSQSIVRLTGSDLPLNFSRVHPAHGKLTWLRVLRTPLGLATDRAINTWFPYDSTPEGLSQRCT